MTTEIDTILRSPKAYQWAQKALEAMEANKVWPTAVNFELWLHYVAAKESEVAVEINQFLKSGAPFTEQVGEEIASHHLPSAKLNGEILSAGKTLSAELDTVSRAIETARETSEAYGQQLATASESLIDEDSDAVRSMVESLSAATRKVREENQALESQLADTTDELARLREHLQQARRDAMTDALTMLFNRKAFDEALEDACAEAARTNDIMSLALIDIDHFKVFNDTWGHQTGDQVIRYVASVINRGLAEIGLPVAAQIVFFFHQHIKRTIRSHQTDGLSVVEALLRAGAMLFAMLANLQVAGEVDDFTYQSRRLGARVRLAIDSGAHGGGGPGFRGRRPEFAHGCRVAAAFHRHLRLQDSGA